jgi:hypothetical protein
MDDGAVAYVDIAQLSPSVAQILRQGTVVSVYGQSLNGSAARRGRRLAAAMVPTCALIVLTPPTLCFRR